MAKEATLQVRIFARQSVEENAMPFVIRVPEKSARGLAAKYANPELIPLEENAFEIK